MPIFLPMIAMAAASAARTSALTASSRAIAGGARRHHAAQDASVTTSQQVTLVFTGEKDSPPKNAGRAGDVAVNYANPKQIWVCVTGGDAETAIWKVAHAIDSDGTNKAQTGKE